MNAGLIDASIHQVRVARIPREKKMSNKFFAADRTAVAVFAAVLLASTAPSMAGVRTDKLSTAETEQGGVVIPARAEPRGFSLLAMARATAVFNTGDHSGTPPDVVNGDPFVALVTTATSVFNVEEGTMLYVPVLYVDDSPPILGDFPDIADRGAVVNYFYSQKEVGVVYTNISVDGKVTTLDHQYLVAVTTSALSDGGGTHYMVVAAYLTPLKKGVHTVTISGLVSGVALCGTTPNCYQFSTPYTVNVK
jgi:hypothetical protein